MLKLNHLTGFGSGASGGGVSPGAPGDGYFFGGNTSGRSDKCDKLDFSLETTAAATDGNLSLECNHGNGLSDGSTNGYILGGGSDAGGHPFQHDIGHKIVFSTDTTSLSTDSDLSIIKMSTCGMSDGGTNGYIAGGYTWSGSGNVKSNKCDMIVFATDTTSAHTDGNLTENITQPGRVSHHSNNGYISGGSSSAGNVKTDKFVFSTTTASLVTDANISLGRSQVVGMSDQLTNGYWSGGWGAANSDVTDKIVFATDTTSAFTQGDLTGARSNAGQGETDGGFLAGYIGGGYTNSGQSDTVEKMTYAAETFAAVTDATLPQTMQEFGTCASGAV